MNSRALWFKIILAIPCLDVTWGLYRLFKAIKSKDVVNIVIAAITIMFASIFGIVDIILLVINGRVFEIDSAK